jgi:hypothetical protein
MSVLYDVGRIEHCVFRCLAKILVPKVTAQKVSRLHASLMRTPVDQSSRMMNLSRMSANEAEPMNISSFFRWLGSATRGLCFATFGAGDDVIGLKS